MQSDSLKEFRALHLELIEEKARIEGRLREIRETLGEDAIPILPKSGAQLLGGTICHAQNRTSLREAIRMALSVKPLTESELLSEIHKLGYVFRTDSPWKSLRAVLEAGDQFQFVNGRFKLRPPVDTTVSHSAVDSSSAER